MCGLDMRESSRGGLYVFGGAFKVVGWLNEEVGMISDRGIPSRTRLTYNEKHGLVT